MKLENTPKIHVESKKSTNKKALGLRSLVSAETRVRSGCPKQNTGDCGINYRGS